MTTVDVWWTPVRLAAPWQEDLLDDVERTRLTRWRRPVDRARSALGAVTLRLAVAARLGADPRGVPVVRRCVGCGGPHGRPVLPGTGVSASITHSGDWVGVALASGVPVGLDVERWVDLADGDLARTVLAAAERGPTDAPPDALQRWVRKEALLKATGEGLTTEPRSVVLSHGVDGARLALHPGREDLDARVVDLSPGSGHVGAVAVLETERPVIAVHPGADLLAGAAPATAAAVV